MILGNRFGGQKLNARHLAVITVGYDEKTITEVVDPKKCASSTRDAKSLVLFMGEMNSKASLINKAASVTLLRS